MCDAHGGCTAAAWGPQRTCEDEAGAASDDEEEAGDGGAAGGLGAAPAQLLQLVHHVLAAGLEGAQVLLQARVHHAHHAAPSMHASFSTARGALTVTTHECVPPYPTHDQPMFNGAQDLIWACTPPCSNLHWAHHCSDTGACYRRAPLKDRQALVIRCGSEKVDKVASEVQQIYIDLGFDPLEGLLEAAAGVEAEWRGWADPLHHLQGVASVM